MGSTTALLLAAGSGTRLGRQGKAFVELAGEPMMAHSLRAIAACRGVNRVVLLVPGSFVEVAERLATEVGVVSVAVRPGGDTRQGSVWEGLQALGADVDVVVCHDAARPLATPELFERVLARLGGSVHGPGATPDATHGEVEGVVPVVRSTDTVKRIARGLVVETIPRDQLGMVQTPQAFRAAALLDAHRRGRLAGLEATDDAMLLEAAGYTVATVEGDASNFKVTTLDDLRRAELLLLDRGAVRPDHGRV